MSREEAIEILKQFKKCLSDVVFDEKGSEAWQMAIKALSQEQDMTIAYLMGKYEDKEPCDDAISREWLMRKATERFYTTNYFNHISAMIEEAPSVTQKSGKCKNCKYFELDHWCEINGVPMICAHEICSKWGNGCKTSEDGYCYLFEPQESEDKE